MIMRKKRVNRKVHPKWQKNIRNKLLAGFLVILPVYVTFFVIKFLFRYVAGELLPIIKRLFGRDLLVPEAILNPLLFAIGISITFTALYIIGLFASNFFGKQIIHFYERIISNTPFVKNIYSSSKQVISTFAASKGKAFKRVVIVEYPRPGMNVIGFATGSITNKTGIKLISVFIPTTPNPTSGFLVYLSKDQVMDTNMSVEEAIKLVISGGILVPEDLDFHIPGEKVEKIENVL